ncbi:MAG: hypothetical protein IIV41_00105, partial [Akkermansia sp.]|nr:hypothetical protein [Akkermansia sp.]
MHADRLPGSGRKLQHLTGTDGHHAGSSGINLCIVLNQNIAIAGNGHTLCINGPAPAGSFNIFYSGDTQKAGDLGRLKSALNPALQRYGALETERKDIFKSTLGRFNRIYAFITQVCRLFDKDIHKFSVFAKFLYMWLPKGDRPVVDIDDKVLLEYYRLEKDFEGGIQLEPAEGGFVPITGEAGHREPKKDPLTVIIE